VDNERVVGWFFVGLAIGAGLATSIFVVSGKLV
jgi:hypothetical protein